MFSIFKSKRVSAPVPLLTDLHSHLLPGLDDGVKTFEEALEVIRVFQQLGYKRLITTPHIMSDVYRNTREGIGQRLDALNRYLAERHIDIAIEAAAEYYLDETFLHQIENNEVPLTVGFPKYILFETNYLNEPYQLKDFIFKITTRGYKPILAHPERYEYALNNYEKLEDLRNRGVLFQLNMLSLINFYSKPVRKMAEKLIDKGWVDLLGSDCHNLNHAHLLREVHKTQYFKKALALPLLNNTL